MGKESLGKPDDCVFVFAAGSLPECSILDVGLGGLKGHYRLRQEKYRKTGRERAYARSRPVFRVSIPLKTGKPLKANQDLAVLVCYLLLFYRSSHSPR